MATGTEVLKGTCEGCGKKAPLGKYKQFSICDACKEKLRVFREEMKER